MSDSGTTPSERYLQHLGRTSFLSLWSHGNPYTTEGIRAGKGVGKELCDLLVVFGNDIVIFSDKYVNFSQVVELSVAWSRWYRKAVAKSAQQLIGAEAWIRRFPSQVFADPYCQCSLPVRIPTGPEMRVHRVCVALGAYDACRRFYGGGSIGSLMINSGLNGIDEHTKPFTVGNVLPEKGFVHVFDDFSLTQILNELDTASDFISYLVAREDFLSAEKPVVISAGEEQLLAIYLTNTDVDGNHAFVLSTTGDPEVVFLDESFWDSMVSNPQYGRKKEADRVSYVWDRLIEHFISFGEHGERRSQDFEFAYRLMASEPRTRRRQLGHALQDLMISTPVEQRAVRVVFSSDVSEKVFVFLICPVQNGLTYAVDRKRRQEMLLAYCNVAKLRFNDSNYIIGIAIDPRDSDEVSADLIALDVSGWGEVDFERAQALQREAKILLDDKIRVRIGRTSEYPEHRKLPVKQAKNSNRAERNKENRKQMQRASRRRNRKKR